LPILPKLWKTLSFLNARWHLDYVIAILFYLI
jgi:hypothetical protein